MSSHKQSVRQSKSWLPREGFHADVLGSIIRQTLLNPTLLIPLVLFAKYADRGREAAIKYPRSLASAKILAALGVARILNNFLSQRALNNWVSDQYDWPNREVIVISGGSDGVGKQTVLGFAKRGIKVAVMDVQQLTYEPPSNVAFFECDITSPRAVEKAASAIRVKFGEPTVIINNAGICRGKPLLESTHRDVTLTFEVNSIAHYTLAREFVPSMVAHNHGMIVTIASSAAWVTAPRMTEYAASKAAALAFHEGLAAELVATYGANKVRTVVVNQGYTRTKLFEGFDVGDTFVAPALHVETVAEAVIDKVLSGDSGQIVLPDVCKSTVAHFRSFPMWIQHRARSQMGNLMRDWKGRQVALPKDEQT